MNLWQQAQDDSEAILTDLDGFGSLVTFTTPASFEVKVTVEVSAMPVRHSTKFNGDTGMMVTAKTARVTVHERTLEAAGYPVRNTDGKIALDKHRVSFVDAHGDTYNGVVREQIPNERIGLIVLTLGDKV